MSQKPSATWADDHQLRQPLSTVSVPMTPQKQLPSLQTVSKDPHQTQSSVTAVQSRHTDSRRHRSIQIERRASDVQETPQFAESESVNSEVECTTPPANEARTRCGRVVKAPVRLDM